MSQAADWGMVGAIVAGAGLVATLATFGLVFYDVFRPERRTRKLTTPGISYFIVPADYFHGFSYAHQNELEHKCKEIVIPPHSESIIDFAVTPNINFNTSQVIFACENVTDRTRLSSRPYFSEVFNRFIKIGSRRHVVPGADTKYDDYVDKYNSYHMVEEWRWSFGTTRALGFKIRTRGPGRFWLSMFFTGENIEGRISDIIIRVQEITQETRLYCVDETHMHLNCAAGIRIKSG